MSPLWHQTLTMKNKWENTQIKEKYDLRLNRINLPLLIIFFKFRQLDAKKEVKMFIFAFCHPSPNNIVERQCFHKTLGTVMGRGREKGEI